MHNKQLEKGIDELNSILIKHGNKLDLDILSKLDDTIQKIRKFDKKQEERQKYEKMSISEQLSYIVNRHKK